MPYIEARSGFPKLKVVTRFGMILPDLYEVPQEGWPVLWLLSEEGAFASDWVRHTAIERLSEERGLAVVLVEGMRSDYEDMKRGLDWNTFVFSELPAYLQDNFPLSCDPGKQFVFGAGMGGLGAIRQALRGQFAAAGAVDADFFGLAEDEKHSTPAWEHRLATIYGDDFRGEEVLENSDMSRLLKTAAVQTPLFFAMSHEDPEKMQTFVDRTKAAGLNVSLLATDKNGWEAREEALRAFLDVIHG